MDIFKLTARPLSSYASPMHSDTIFGAFCWAFRYKHGEAKLMELLETYTNGDPPVIFSNGYTSGLLPFPLVNMRFREDGEGLSGVEKLERYKRRKMIKRMQYLSIKDFNNVINGRMSFSQTGRDQEDVITYGNLVNRISGTVSDTDETGGLFARKETFTKGSLTVYAKVAQGWGSEFAQITELAFSLGIGADKSIGKGIFKTEGIEKCDDFSIPANSNGFVTLSNYIPDINDPVDGNYRTLVKYGKLDREFARTDRPFKKPLLMFAEGSVFYARDVREYYGRVVGNVSNYNNNIVHCGMAFTLPVFDIVKFFADKGGTGNGR